MTRESKTEIVIAIGVGAFFLYLWWANKAAGVPATQSLGSPSISLDTAGGQPLTGVSPFTIPAAVQGLSPDDSVSNVFNLGGFTSGVPGTGGDCGCNAGTGTSQGPQFGSLSDLIAYLSQPAGSLSADSAALENGGWS